MGVKTNWFVITGGPSSGKTKTLEYLAFLGYYIVPEAARILIDSEKSKRRKIEEIRADECAFQKKVLDMKIEAEERVPKERVTFFERGIPDSIAYFKVCGDKNSSTMIDFAVRVSKKRRYRGVFLLEPLTYEEDYARVEGEELAERLSELLYEAYTELGYGVIRVPVKPIKERVEFILSRIPSLSL